MSYEEIIKDVNKLKHDMENAELDLKRRRVDAIKLAYEEGYVASTDYHVNRMYGYSADTVERIFRIVNFYMQRCKKYHQDYQLAIKWRNQNSPATIGILIDRTKIEYHPRYTSMVPVTKIEDAHRLIVFKKGHFIPFLVTYDEFVELGMVGKYED